MKRLGKTFRCFVYACIGILFAILCVVTAFNAFIPLFLSLDFYNPLWLLLYIVEPFLLFADIYVYHLLDDLEWWV
jgi:hypothetical protein